MAQERSLSNFVYQIIVKGILLFFYIFFILLISYCCFHACFFYLSLGILNKDPKLNFKVNVSGIGILVLKI